jgi:hypothetical protein
MNIRHEPVLLAGELQGRIPSVVLGITREDTHATAYEHQDFASPTETREFPHDGSTRESHMDGSTCSGAGGADIGGLTPSQAKSGQRSAVRPRCLP